MLELRGTQLEQHVSKVVQDIVFEQHVSKVMQDVVFEQFAVLSATVFVFVQVEVEEMVERYGIWQVPYPNSGTVA